MMISTGVAAVRPLPLRLWPPMNRSRSAQRRMVDYGLVGSIERLVGAVEFRKQAVILAEMSYKVAEIDFMSVTH